MTSIDTNILLPAVETSHPKHSAAAAFVQSLHDRKDVAVSEFILLELYVLLRNPAVLMKPLGSSAAVDVCEAFRQHPRWQILGFPPDSRAFHDALWPRLRQRDFGRRRAYDSRCALALVEQGVTHFATVNVSDFKGFGFTQVWNPLD
ncbi:MAG: TA system VapC family ribonuclease toxin [Limisphaerales bacterium]